MSHAVQVFLEADRARRAGLTMTPRSARDKEFFPQDWFMDRLQATGLPYLQNGRNSYPDFWVGDGSTPPVEGFEIKSLSYATGKPARADFDSNSTVPSGKKDGRDIFLVFFLYTGSGTSARQVHSLVFAHTDLINADHQIAGDHVNAGVSGFGSYGDGNIRNRKMYRFPHPYALRPQLEGRCSLVVPASWNLRDARLRKVDSIPRTVTPQRVRKFTIDLQDQANPIVQTEAYPNAGQRTDFDVFEAV